ncbi:MAG: sensor histidine kinase [Vulcanimicrobiaceae bacterium]
MIARLTAVYLAIFATVLAAISIAAFVFVGQQYHDLLGPAMQTAEAQHAYAQAMRRVALTIGGIDLPLLTFVGVASYALARLSVAPLIEARERERNFSIDVAHELRSPLATIASVAQAAGADAGADMKTRLETIDQAALDAGSLVGDLLTLAREPRPDVLVREPVELAAIATSCAREFIERARSKAIAVDVAAKSCIVSGDERRLRELVRNLLDNALRHAATRVSLSTQSVRTRGLLIVEDDGSGIAATERERIFERFYRRDGEASGVGVGLAIVAWIVRAHEGTVSAQQPSTGRGTAIVADFPLARPT